MKMCRNYVCFVIFSIVCIKASFPKAVGNDEINMSRTIFPRPSVPGSSIPTYNINKVRNITKRSPQLIRELLNRRQENLPKRGVLGTAASIAGEVHNALHSVGEKLVNTLTKPVSLGITAQVGHVNYQSMFSSNYEGIGMNEGPPPSNEPYQHHGPPPDDQPDRPPHHHHNPPPHHYNERPSHHHGPPDDYDRPPFDHHHHGPPHHHEPPPHHNHGRPPYHHGRPQHHHGHGQGPPRPTEEYPHYERPGNEGDVEGNPLNNFDPDSDAKNNIVGYTDDNFPVILLNENEIRR